MNSGPFSNISPVVKNLLIINIIFYIATMMFADKMVQWFAVFYFNSPMFKIWQIITYMFMHSPVSFAHILFNMFALYTFGSTLEYVMGQHKAQHQFRHHQSLLRKARTMHDSENRSTACGA